jgi:non-homologous end joining protein Ku
MTTKKPSKLIDLAKALKKNLNRRKKSNKKSVKGGE